MAATIREVARLAGVSVATVSRVINGKGPIRPETEQRVREIVEQLRYLPHGAARSLITNSTNTLGVLLPDIYGEFFSELIRGIDATARRSGYHLLVSSSHSDGSEIEALLRAMRGRVDGLIVMSPDLDAPAIAANLPETLPVVLLNGEGNARAVAHLGVDNYGGARAMTEHLASFGYSPIAHLSGPPKNRDAQERLRGYRDAIVALGPNFTSLELAGDFSEESGYRAGRALLALPVRPRAVFAANDSMAIGCLSALREAGVRVPEEIALGGFDDIPVARYISPALTSVHIAIADLGARAIERLLARLGGAADTQPATGDRLETHLVIRESCGGKLANGAPSNARPKDRPTSQPA